MESLYIAAFFVVLIIITLLKGVRIVPQGYKHICQRLGKYNRTLNPGLNVIVPYIDSIPYQITTNAPSSSRLPSLQ